jgi:sugar lactone lactonase YvrE
MQAVPTSVAIGPDGAYYVGQLTGFPFPVGGANVYRVVPGEEPTVYASGFTNIIDIAFGRDGSLWVLEIATNSLLADGPGGLWKVPPGGGTGTLVLTDPLVLPGAVEVAPDGALYISNFSIFPDGQLLRVDW